MGWRQKLLGKSSEPKPSDRASTSPAPRDADVRWMSPDEPDHAVAQLRLPSNPPLHIACALGHLEAAKTLVDLGADVHATSKTGTALDIARREDKPDVVAWLDRCR